jgi:hypothetical protein
MGAVRQRLLKSGAIEGENIAKVEGMDLGEGFAMVNTEGVAMTKSFLTDIFPGDVRRSSYTWTHSSLSVTTVFIPQGTCSVCHFSHWSR